MWQCSKCGADVADEIAACWICGATADGASALPPPLLPETPVDALVIEHSVFGRPPSPQVGVPRRFGIGTMMILVTMYAFLFATMTTLGTPPIVFACISIFVSGVGACQVLLFKGKNPRRASIVGGMATLAVMTFAGYVFVTVSEWAQVGILPAVSAFIVLPLLTIPLGGFLGYVVGCFIASIFLVRKEPPDE